MTITHTDHAAIWEAEKAGMTEDADFDTFCADIETRTGLTDEYGDDSLDQDGDPCSIDELVALYQAGSDSLRAWALIQARIDAKRGVYAPPTRTIYGEKIHCTYRDTWDQRQATNVGTSK